MSSSILHLKLTGNDPRSWGRQQGEAFTQQIRELNAIRQELLAGFLKGWSREKILQLCRDHAATLKAEDPALFEEVLGMSETTGVSVEDLMALNAYTDMRDFSAGDHTRSEDGCSILAAKSASVNFSAQTWDMHGSATPYMLLLEIPGPQPMHVLTITGCLGLCGVNRAGVSVMINNMHCRETNRQGIVWPALVRKMLTAKDAAGATKILAHNIPSSGHNYLIFDRHTATNIETSGTRFEVTASIPEGGHGYIFHTNHYVGTLKETEILDRQSPSTHKRFDALVNFARGKDVSRVSSDQLIDGLFVNGATCEILNIAPSPNSPHLGATCGGIGVDHVAGIAFAFRGLFSEGKRIEWKLGA